jgi:hypothetical protein
VSNAQTVPHSRRAWQFVHGTRDRYANLEVSYLLQRMEAYRGLAILTTNQRDAIDTAFVRRLRFIINFPFPDLAERLGPEDPGPPLVRWNLSHASFTRTVLLGPRRGSASDRARSFVDLGVATRLCVSFGTHLQVE